MCMDVYRCVAGVSRLQRSHAMHGRNLDRTCATCGNPKSSEAHAVHAVGVEAEDMRLRSYRSNGLE